MEKDLEQPVRCTPRSADLHDRSQWQSDPLVIREHATVVITMSVRHPCESIGHNIGLRYPLRRTMLSPPNETLQATRSQMSCLRLGFYVSLLRHRRVGLRFIWH